MASRMLGRARLGDARRTARAVALLARWLMRPGASVAQASPDGAAAKAGYRLLANRRVQSAALGAAIYEEAGSRCGALARVYLAQDTTTLTWGGRAAIAGLGPADSRETQGMLVHTTLAIDPGGSPLGILDQRIWTRPPEKLPPKHLRAMEDRESMKWQEGMRAAASRLPETCHPVFILDSEGDIHEVFAEAASRGWGVIVRSQGDRRVAGEEERLLAAVRARPAALRYELRVPRKAGEAPARDAEMELRHATVTLDPNCKREPDREPVTVNVVLATEVTLGVEEPLEWCLVTTEPVRDAEEALGIVVRYTWRWRIEEFHLTLKSGCRIESHQFDHADRIEKVVVMLSAVAGEVARLTYLARAAPEMLASEALDETSLEALTRWARPTRNRLPDGPLLLRDAVRLIGRLGGHLGRKCDGPVGVRTFWKGWTRLQDMALVLRC